MYCQIIRSRGMRFLYIVMLVMAQNLQGQVNITLAYDNRSTSYDDALGLSGFHASLLFKAKTKGYFGFEYAFNGITRRKPEALTLVKSSYDQVYHDEYFYANGKPTDPAAQRKVFTGRQAYRIESYAFKRYYQLAHKPGSKHFMGYTAGISIFRRFMKVDADSTEGRIFQRNQTPAKLMLGADYRREHMFGGNIGLVYGISLAGSLSLPLRNTDFKGYNGFLFHASLSAGLRCYFRKHE